MTARLRDESPVTEVDGDQDKDGYRTFHVTYLVLCDPGDGPNAAMDCLGLPRPGDWYRMDADGNPWAWCYWAMTAKKWSPANEPATQYKVTKTFSTKPENTQHCRDKAVEDPLSELPKISGSYAKYTEEATVDRFGRAITYSSFERIRGPQNEWDRNRITVKIQQNVSSALLGYVMPSLMIDCVNAYPIWGFPPRTVKLSSAPWDKKYYGPCIPYYTRTLDFDVRYTKLDTGAIETWDRYILDESGKVLQGKWVGSGATLTYVPGFQVAGMTGTPNPNNPTHFMKCADVAGNLQKMVLNGHGVPAGVMTTTNQLFASISNGNVGRPLDNGSFWVLMLGDPADPTPWDATFVYNLGRVVLNGGSSYVCLADNVTTQPPSSDWAPVATNQGTYNAGTTYSLGDYVSGAGSSGAAGYRLVQKYPGADFSQLMVPLSL